MADATGLPLRLALATRNEHKIKEIVRICPDWPVEWVVPGPDEWDAPEETGETYLDNALLKARSLATAWSVPALADDSGIEVDALGGKPGPLSARYAGPGATDEENLAAMVRAMKGVPGGGRTARYRAVAAIAWPDGTEVWTEATCEGVLRTRPTGDGGFGYDPIFEPVGWDVTVAELAPEEKDRISHRGQALRALREHLMGSEG